MDFTIDLIPFGKENAVRRKTLAVRTGMSDRDVRLRIKELRREYVILNIQDGSGYFRPTENEREMVERYQKQEESRAKSIFWTLKPVREFLNEKSNKRI